MLKVALVYLKDTRGLSGHHYINHGYRFFVQGILPSPRIEAEACPIIAGGDCRLLSKYDVLLFFHLRGIKYTSANYQYLDSVKAVKIAKGLDAHDMTPERIGELRQWGIDTIVNMCSVKYARHFIPDDIAYHQFMFGINKDFFKAPQWDLRRKDKILLTGVSNPKYYYLRGLCADTPQVKYVKPAAGHKNKQYAKLLGSYQAGIAACTVDAVYKYCESPATGALTFMEVNDINGCEELGYTDGENAIFINEDNYKAKFAEYMADVDNPKWQAIAERGREYTLQRWENQVEVDRLIDLMYELA